MSVLGSSPGALVIEVIDRDLVEVSAVGSFDRSHRAAIADRVNRLIAGGPIRLCIDLSSVSTLDPAVAGDLVAAKRRLEARGGALEFSGVVADLLDVLNMAESAASS